MLSRKDYYVLPSSPLSALIIQSDDSITFTRIKSIRQKFISFLPSLVLPCFTAHSLTRNSGSLTLIDTGTINPIRPYPLRETMDICGHLPLTGNTWTKEERIRRNSLFGMNSGERDRGIYPPIISFTTGLRRELSSSTSTNSLSFDPPLPPISEITWEIFVAYP